MDNLIIKLRSKLFIILCILLIIYFLFLNEFKNSSCFFVISCVLIILSLLFVIMSIFEVIKHLKEKRNPKKKIIRKTDGFLDAVYVYSRYIVNYSFYVYFFVYIVFKLDEQSIIFNYLLLVIFGIFLGYRIAVKVFFYFEEKENQHTS